MNCREIQEELYLCAGVETLPADMKRHLDGCPECSQVWQELSAVLNNAGTDETYYQDRTFVTQMVTRVDTEIDLLELSKETSIWSLWKTYVPVAAAVVLILGLSFTVNQTDWFGSSSDQADLTSRDSLVSILNGGSAIDLTSTDVSYLLTDFATERNQSATELLLEDLTDEEYEYLQNNLNAGEIL